ncbi:MAG: M1 family metallopeptidase [Polyangiales bacterium]
MRPSAILLASLVASCSARPQRVAAPVVATATPPAATAPAPEVPAPRADGRLPDGPRPMRERVVMDVDPAAPRFSGTAHIDLRVAAPTRVVVLHARSLNVSSVRAVTPEAIPAQHSRRHAHGGRNDPEELVIVFDRPLPQGDTRIEVAFDGAWGDDLQGLYRARVGEDWYAVTDFEPSDARRAFPCFDEPEAKIPFTVELRTPRGLRALSNMPEEDHRDEGERTVWRFRETPPTSSYLVAFVVGPWDVYDGPTSPVPVRVIAPRGRAALGATAAQMAAEHLRILSEYFGQAFPYPKLDLVAVPDFLHGGMENPGLITFRDSLLLAEPARMTAGSRRSMAGVIAHELAHQWFGDFVTMRWWDDLWLNEGFASWMGDRVVDRWHPEWEAHVGNVAGLMWARRADSMSTTHAVRAPVTSTADAVASFDTMTYVKGSSVIAMIESWIGEGPFREGIRAYMRDHAWGNTTADDLLRALSQSSGRDVYAVARSYLDQPGLPLLAMDVTCEPGQPPRLAVSQRPFRIDGEAPPAAWSVPVCARYDAAPAPKTVCAVLNAPEASFALETDRCPRWILPNPGGAGHYWTRLPEARLRALLDAPGAMDVPAKLELLATLEALRDRGDVSITEVLDVYARLARDPSPHIAARVADSFWAVDRTLITAAARPRFEAWVRAQYSATARRMGFTAAPGDSDAVKNLRRAVLTLVGMHTEDPWAHAEARRITQRWIRDPAGVDPEALALALPIATRRGDAAHFDALLAALARATLPQERNLILGAFTGFDDIALLRRGMELGFDAERVRAQDLRSLFGRWSHRAEGRAVQYAWMRERFDAAKQARGRNARWLINLAGITCDESDARAAAEFLSTRIGDLEGSERGLRENVAHASQCARNRSRYAADAARWFESHAPRR